MKKILIYSAVVFFFILGLTAVSYKPAANSVFILSDESVEGKIRPYAEALVDEMNKNNASGKEPYRLYTARFDLNSEIKELKKYDKNAVLWLGGEKVVDFKKLKNYGTVLIASSLQAHLFPKAYYFPIPYMKENLRENKPEFYALINTPPLIENILREKNLPYRVYDTNNLDEIRKDMPRFKAVFTQQTGLDKADVNLNPIFLEMAASGILLAGYRFDSIKSSELNVLGDFVFYYHTEDEAQLLVEKIENNAAEISEMTKQSKNYTRAVLNVKPQAQRLAYILKNKKNMLFDINTDINIDTQGKAGDYHYGDYWLGHDLGTAFKKEKLNVTYSYLNFPLLYDADFNLIIRGHLRQINHLKHNIFWLAYPSHVPEDYSLAQYSETVFDMCQKYDAVAVSSEKLYRLLSDKCHDIYYIPQFTNTARFYPEYDEKFQSEILFVGNAHFYRKAPNIVYRKGLPIDIYGNFWDDGMAKGSYIDNRVLRKYYSSAKIVLNDTSPLMRQYGFISNRVFDVTAAGGFLISDYMPEIEAIYGDTIPMWKTEDELIELVEYYLNPEHEEERKDKAERAREITLKNFTSEIAAEKFKDILHKIH